MIWKDEPVRASKLQYNSAVCCANCGKRVFVRPMDEDSILPLFYAIGGYASLDIFDSVGDAFVICRNCYAQELERAVMRQGDECFEKEIYDKLPLKYSWTSEVTLICRGCGERLPLDSSEIAEYIKEAFSDQECCLCKKCALKRDQQEKEA